MRALRRVRHDDEGAALVLALVFMFAWSLVIYAVLDLSVVGVEVGEGSHQRTEYLYAADAAIETVVAGIANDDDPLAAQCPEPTLQFNGVDVTMSCVLFTGPNVRVADLEAAIAGDAQIRARVTFDDTTFPATVTVTNWTVLR